MMGSSFRLLFLVFYTILILSVYCTTHWVITDDGKIQAQMDSIFQLRRPYDFLALTQQEQRALQVEALKRELMQQKSQIDQNEDKDTQLEEKIYRTESDCILAGRPLTQFDLYSDGDVSWESAGINIEEYLHNLASPVEKSLSPDCTKAFDLPFSMFAYEHLEGIRDRDNLTLQVQDAELVLGEMGKMDDLGDRLGFSLGVNNTSWVLHSLAALYWHAKGEALSAIECLRRALHLAPRHYRYIPQVQLGNLLHHVRYSEEAAVVLHAAVDHHRHYVAAHVNLGHVYASLGLYNVSILCFENALFITPSDAALRKKKYAIQCHSKLEAALETQHRSLQRTLEELREYQKRHEEWLSLQQKLLLEQATPEMKLESRLEYEEQKIRESADGRGQDCFQYQQDGHTFLSCNMRRDQLEHRSSTTELLLDLQNLLRTVETEVLRIGQHVLKQRPVNVRRLVPHVTPLRPSKIIRTDNLAAEALERILGKGFPSTEQCQDAIAMPNWDEFPPVYMAAESKGFTVKKYLNEELDLDPSTSHPEPWYPPICERLEETLPGVDEVPGVRDRHAHSHGVNPDQDVVSYVVVYSPIGKLDEAGQRINAALKKGVAPRWLLYHLAALYWRAQGNTYNGIECLRRSLAIVPDDWRDVPLMNLASLLYRGGHIDDAVTFASQAVHLADYEAETNFLLANLYSGKGNLTGAWHHYERTLTLASVGTSTHTLALQYLTALACHSSAQMSPINSRTLHLPVCDHEIASEDGVCLAEGSCLDADVSLIDMDKLDEEDMISLDLEEEETDITTGGKQPAHEGEDPQGPDEKLVSTTSLRVELTTKDSFHLLQPMVPETPSLIIDDPLPDVLLRVREKEPAPPSPVQACPRANQLDDFRHFTSTWLSVSAKGIDISYFLVPIPPEGTELEEPICPSDLPVSLHMLDHLAGVRHRHLLPEFAENGLKEALQTLGDKPWESVSVDVMATRISRSLEKNQTSWVLTTAAALYWRVIGSGHRAVDCLRHSLHYAPRHMKDFPLISLANILHRAGLYNNALVVANMALEISPKFVVIHFTMANIYAAKGDLEKATSFYQSTLALQSTFEPARDRLRAIECASVTDTGKEVN